VKKPRKRQLAGHATRWRGGADVQFGDSVDADDPRAYGVRAGAVNAWAERAINEHEISELEGERL